MIRKRVTAIIMIIFILSLLVSCNAPLNKTLKVTTSDQEVKKEEVELPKQIEQTKEVEPPKPKIPQEMEVRGIYLTGYSVGLESRFNSLVNLINTTELNAMVIDVLDDDGEVSYKSAVPLVKELGSDSTTKIKDIHKVMEILQQNKIYPIARIVTFKDNNAATKKPELAIKNKDGSIWRDNKKIAWLNPYNKESWEYPISVAEEAVDLGFKEIQFDYVRFPTDGNRSLIDYG